jgi:hypothetical protein
MKGQKEKTELMSRRNILKGSAVFLVGGAVGRFSNAYAASAAAPAAGNPPPLPWKWVKLDPMEAGRRAFHSYLDKKG